MTGGAKRVAWRQMTLKALKVALMISVLVLDFSVQAFAPDSVPEYEVNDTLRAVATILRRRKKRTEH
ncbi:MAG: hypothetical protein HY648_14100 [Acidobacteria bacterium]|nr:hypothetical protein [Acidobacteriota bacterium]